MAASEALKRRLKALRRKHGLGEFKRKTRTKARRRIGLRSSMPRPATKGKKRRPTRTAPWPTRKTPYKFNPLEQLYGFVFNSITPKGKGVWADAFWDEDLGAINPSTTIRARQPRTGVEPNR